MKFKDWLQLDESSYNTRRRKGLDPPRAEDFGSRATEPEYVKKLQQKLHTWGGPMHNIDPESIYKIPIVSPKSLSIPPKEMPKDVLDYFKKQRYESEEEKGKNAIKMKKIN